jgi:hypothetical protein
MVTDAKLKVLDECVRRTFYSLEIDFQYIPSIQIRNSSVLIEWITWEYVCENRNRTVTIGYSTSEVNDELCSAFGVTITRLPYKSFSDFFSLDIYLNSIGKDISTNVTNDFTIDEAEWILKELFKALNKEALSIISGEVWMDEFYPRW